MTDSPPVTCSDAELTRRIKHRARETGFELCGIAPAIEPSGLDRLHEWIDRGYAGEMGYLPRRREAYEHPGHVLPDVRSVIVLGMNYRTAEPAAHAAGSGRVARYAWGSADYHDLLRERMRPLADLLHVERPGCRTRAVVDTAPLLERDFARLAGLGWFGKNTMLIHKRLGSWLFLAALLTSATLDADDPHETTHCGTCTRCLDVCPTDAFPEPGVLDARRCISYLTIELRNQPIPLDLRSGMEDWVFGCDLCQEVCPWNRKAPRSPEPAFQPRDDLRPFDLVEWLTISPDEFQQRLQGTPLERPGRAGLLRNALIALGNSGGTGHEPALQRALNDDEPLIRGAAAWAAAKLGLETMTAELHSRLEVENNADVRRELELALRQLRHSPGPNRHADAD